MRNPISILRKKLAQRVEPPRSDRWPEVRKSHLMREGWCRFCGGVKNLEVHHVWPFHLYPTMELDDSNLITLCERSGRECHLHVGHNDDWQSFNVCVREQAKSPRAGQTSKSVSRGTMNKEER